MSSQLVGSVGAGLLLLVFALNLIGRLSTSGPIYLTMNGAGGALAAWRAYVGGVIPSVMLKPVWALTVLVRLMLRTRKGSPV